MSLILAVDKLPIPIFGKEEVDKVEYCTKALALEAAFSAMSCAKVQKTTKHGNLPDIEAAANISTATDKEKAANKMNRDSCGVLVTSFFINPSLNAMI